MKYKLTLNGKNYIVEVEVAEPMSTQEFQSYAPAPAAPAAPALEATPSTAPAAPVVVGDGTAVDAPMPGTILKVCVSQGQQVKEGDVLVVLEAMKMENEIMAPKGGTIKQVLVTKGTSVDTGAPLVLIG